MTQDFTFDSSRPWIAVIDDDEDHRLLLRHSLELRGFHVMTFGSSEEALGWDNPTNTRSIMTPLVHANLILLDVSLPGISGVETISFLRENPQTKNIPIAMLTADRGAETVLKCIRAGANDYFVKPLVFSEVMGRIEKLIEDPSGLLKKFGNSEVRWNFQDYLVREMKRCQRFDEMMGFFMGGIRRLPSNRDNLKPSEIDQIWNRSEMLPSDNRTPAIDSFVHGIRQGLREYDTIVSFGSAEFACILPNISRDGLEAVIRRCFRYFDETISLPSSSRQDRWGILIGGALFPLDGTDRLGLLSSAETRLSNQPPPKKNPIHEQEIAFLKTRRCSGCGFHFSFPKLSSRRLVPIGRESDLRLLFEDFEPFYYSVVACTNCGLAVLENDILALKDLDFPVFRWKYRKRSANEKINAPSKTLIPDELKKFIEPVYEAKLNDTIAPGLLQSITKEIKDADYLLTEIKKGVGTQIGRPVALARYLLARETYRLLGGSPLRRARISHRIAWIYRSSHDFPLEKNFLSEALDFYLTAFHYEDLGDNKPGELEILYLIGDLYVRLGNEQNALGIFERLVRDPRVEKNDSFRKMVYHRWYDARHETLPDE